MPGDDLQPGHILPGEEGVQGGVEQQQRVAIGCVLVMDQKLMLFDELTSALDPELIGDLLKVIDLAPKGMTMVVVTHKMGVAQRAANRLLMLLG